MITRRIFALAADGPAEPILLRIDPVMLIAPADEVSE